MLPDISYTESDKALLLAVIDRRYDAIDAALAAGASPNLTVSGIPVLCTLALRGEVEAIDKLLKAGGSASQADDSGRTALMYAAMGCPSEGSAKCIERILLSAGHEELNRVDAAGLTALDLAKRLLNAPQSWTLIRMHAQHRTRLQPWLAHNVFLRGARG